jgi:hypothetical protein
MSVHSLSQFNASQAHYKEYQKRCSQEFATHLDKCAVKMMRTVYHTKQIGAQPLVITQKIDPKDIAEEEIQAEDPFTKEGIHFVFEVKREDGSILTKCWGCMKRDRELFENYEPNFS